MGDELGNGGPQGLFSEQDEAVQAGLFDTANESFGVSVQIRRAWRQLHGLDPHPSQQVQEFCREQRVSIVDQIALAEEDSVHGVGDLAADLAHPQAVGGGGDTRDLHLARGQIEEEQHDKALQSPSRPHFDREEIRCRDPLPMSREELLPGRLSTPLGRGLEAMPFENRRNGAARQLVSQVG
jgi:hypothetical protein